jgi:hypothetical protein
MRGLSAWSEHLPSERTPVVPGTDLPALFHRLNNQLGIILANAELLEVQLADPAQRARAAQVVSSALDAMGTSRDLRSLVGLITSPNDTPTS